MVTPTLGSGFPAGATEVEAKGFGARCLPRGCEGGGGRAYRGHIWEEKIVTSPHRGATTVCPLLHPHLQTSGDTCHLGWDNPLGEHGVQADHCFAEKCTGDEASLGTEGRLGALGSLPSSLRSWSGRERR